MNFTRTCLAVLLGFTLGILFYPARSHAQHEGMKVIVQEVPSLGSSGMVVTQGSQIVGFSCTTTERKEAVCYVASTQPAYK
jgi:hypothetical protein